LKGSNPHDGPGKKDAARSPAWIAGRFLCLCSYISSGTIMMAPQPVEQRPCGFRGVGALLYPLSSFNPEGLPAPGKTVHRVRSAKAVMACQKIGLSLRQPFAGWHPRLEGS
jgi:hypothetical protein